MTTNQLPIVTICQYRVRPGKEAEMERLLAKHWPTLRSLGLATEEPARIYRGLASEKPEGMHGAERCYVEIFAWSSPDGPELAHQTPEVLAVWEPMGAICESMDFPHYQLLPSPA